MNYSPEHMYIWDPWCMVAPDGVHLYHLQLARDEAGRAREELLGHAVSTDLIHWRELPEAFGPDATRTDDDRQVWTGCALWHDRQAYLFYTMRGSATACQSQAIGLATSPDGMHFERYAGNPVIVPDRRWYADVQNPVPGLLDCRDLVVIPAPGRRGWYGYFATRRPAPDLANTSVIAAAYSEDLVHWEQLRPVFTPDNCACVEVPDVFELNGLWYLTCLTGMMYGSFHSFTDPNIYAGTIYAVSDSPLGPFRQLRDNVLLGARTAASPLSVRSFLFEGERHVLYTDRERNGHSDAGDAGLGTLTTPKLLGTSGDELQVRYSPRVEARVSAELALDPAALRATAAATDWGQIWQRPPIQAQIGDDGAVSLHNPTTFSVLPLGMRPESFILEAEVTLRGAAAAGLVLRMDSWIGDFLRLDGENDRIHYIRYRQAEFQEARQCPIASDRAYRLKVVSRREHTEIYLDDVLKLSFACYRNLGGELGLFVERGTALFRHLRLRQLD